MAFQKITDPQEFPVQLNIKVPHWLREHLTEIAEKQNVSLAELCRSSLEASFPRRKVAK